MRRKEIADLSKMSFKQKQVTVVLLGDCPTACIIFYLLLHGTEILTVLQMMKSISFLSLSVTERKILNQKVKYCDHARFLRRSSHNPSQMLRYFI